MKITLTTAEEYARFQALFRARAHCTIGDAKYEIIYLRTDIKNGGGEVGLEEVK